MSQCESCNHRKACEGLILCDICLTRKHLKETIALELEIKLLKAELKQKDEKLSELQNGLPIEKAKEDGTPVLAWKAGSYFHATVQHCEDGVWGRLTDDFMFKASREQPDRFITLPSTDTNGG